MLPCVEVKTDMHLFIMSVSFYLWYLKTLFTNVCPQAKRTYLYSQKQSQKYSTLVGLLSALFIVLVLVLQ